MSGPTEPISLERFAEALKDLPLVSLRLKILEIRNSGEKWEDFEAGVFERDPGDDEEQDRGVVPNGDATTANQSATTDRSHPAWSDGTFQVGTIRAEPNTTGGGGSLSDADLAKLIEERMRVLEASDDEGTDAGGENGLHL
ncbi:unnamed protein product [Parascedosporium putredinis]|uniref:Uncharacterized protein n=1 Tax=Parascedosporium putredinis TaxID=1442378 RepID=A0A9P1MD68_9PEZI|nr:unnamed protein product [Parascedosporium putredinis]CAI7999034.1 unnamed protein product [Parascedosporium putredinis]